MGNVRNDGGRLVLAALLLVINGLVYKTQHATQDDGGIADGTTDGKLQNVNAVDFKVAGLTYTKAATDDLWNLAGETDTTASQYRAYWLYLNASGTASVAAGSNASSAALALAALPALDVTKSVIGVYVANPSCDFNGAAGLAAQGTIYDGVPDGVPGMSAAPSITTLVNF